MIKRIAIALVMLTGLGVASFQFYEVWKDVEGLKTKVVSLQGESNALEEDNRKIGDKIKYLGQSDNLIKELKARFNYRFSDERTIIVAPKEKQN